MIHSSMELNLHEKWIRGRQNQRISSGLESSYHYQPMNESFTNLLNCECCCRKIFSWKRNVSLHDSKWQLDKYTNNAEFRLKQNKLLSCKLYDFTFQRAHSTGTTLFFFVFFFLNFILFFGMRARSCKWIRASLVFSITFFSEAMMVFNLSFIFGFRKYHSYF